MIYKNKCSITSRPNAIQRENYIDWKKEDVHRIDHHMLDVEDCLVVLFTGVSARGRNLIREYL